MNTWILALKEWNQKKGGAWCVPRKGSEEHRQVMELMGGTPKKAPVKKAPVKQNIKFKKKAPSFKYTKEEATKQILKTTNKLGPNKKKVLNDFINTNGIHRLFYVSPPNYNSIGKNLPIDMSEKMEEKLKEIWKNSPLNDEAKHHRYKWMYADVGATPNELSTNKQLRSGFPFKSEYLNASRDKLILENRFRDQKKYFEKRQKLKEKNLKAGRKVNIKQFDSQTDRGLDKINDKYGLLDKFRYNGHIKQTLKREYKPIIDDRVVDIMGMDDDIYATQRKQSKKYKYNQYGRGHRGGEIIDPKVDLIKSLDSFWKEITGEGLTKKQVKNIQKKKQHGGNWWDMAKLLNTLNNFMIQPPPTVDTETGEVVVRSGFDMI